MLKEYGGKGYPTVAVGYTRAPAARYPAPVLQVNEALGFLQREASRLGIDAGSIVIAGDSAGAHIAAQLAAGLTSRDYAAMLGLKPERQAGSLKGTVLFCGVYDMTGLDLTGRFGSLVRSALFAYFGTPNPLDSPGITEASVPRYVTEAFPPSFISVGNDDPLAAQSTMMAQALRDRGVRVETLFFPADREPKLGHEYQFDLDKAEGRQALERLAAFLESIAP